MVQTITPWQDPDQVAISPDGMSVAYTLSLPGNLGTSTLYLADTPLTAKPLLILGLTWGQTATRLVPDKQ